MRPIVKGDDIDDDDDDDDVIDDEEKDEDVAFLSPTFNPKLPLLVGMLKSKLPLLMDSL